MGVREGWEALGVRVPEAEGVAVAQELAEGEARADRVMVRGAVGEAVEQGVGVPAWEALGSPLGLGDGDGLCVPVPPALTDSVAVAGALCEGAPVPEPLRVAAELEEEDSVGEIELVAHTVSVGAAVPVLQPTVGVAAAAVAVAKKLYVDW